MAEHPEQDLQEQSDPDARGNSIRDSRSEPRPQSDPPTTATRLLTGRRDFRLLWIGETTSMAGNATTSLLLPLIGITVLHTGTFTIALIEAAVWLPWLLIGLPVGVLVDRWRNRPVLIGCDVVGALALLTLPVAAALDLLSVPQLLLVALVSGVRAVFFEPAFYKLIPVLATEPELPAANSLLHGSESAALVLGPGLAGLLSAAVGAVAGVVVDAASFIVSALCLFRIRVEEPRPDPAAGHGQLVAQIVEGVRVTAGDPYLRTIAATAGLLNFALSGMGALQVVFLVRTNSSPSGTTGLLIGLAGIGGLFGAALASRFARRVGTARSMIVTTTASVVCGLIVPLTSPGVGLVWYTLGTLGQVAFIVATNVVTATFTQRYCPRSLLGRVAVLSRMTAYAVAPLGALIAGGLAVQLGVRPAMWLLAASALAAVALQLASPIAHRRDLPTTMGAYEPVPAAGA